MRRFAPGLGLCLTLLAGTALAQNPPANQYSSITVFGDSLSDPGNIPRFFGFNVPAPPYFQNQFSNGPIYAKNLNPLFGISTPLNDYAIGGALTGAHNFAGLPGNPAVGLPNAGVDGEISLYLAGNRRPTARDLFIVWAGGNDFIDVLDNRPPPPGLSAAQLTSLFLAPTGPVTTALANLTADVSRLAAAGVKNFVVPNLPNLGQTPSYNGSPATSVPASLLSTLHNQLLGPTMGQLQQQLHVNITFVDIGALFTDVVANPVKYGFDPAHVADECIMSAACVSQHLNYLFWDGVHPTGLSHLILSEAYFASLSGPTTVGPQMELDKIAQRDLFDRISARAAALRNGAAGFTVDNVGGVSGRVDPDSDSRLAGFLAGSYGWGSQDTRQNVVGFDYQHHDIVAGLDYRATDWLAVGGLIGYGDTSADLEAGFGSQSVQAFQVALYATAFMDGWYGSVAGTYAYTDWDKLHRNAFVANQTASATSGGQVLGARIEGGYAMRLGALTIGPSAELRYAHYRIGSYAESGAVGLNQEVDGQGEQSLIGQVGVQAAIATTVDGYSVTPALHVDFGHEFRNPTRTIVTRLVSQPATFVATGLDPTSDNWMQLGAGVNVQLADALSALLDFDSIVAHGRTEDYSLTARLRYSF